MSKEGDKLPDIGHKPQGAVVVSEEVAKDQLDLLLDYYDIDKNDIEIEQGPEALQTLMNGLVRAIQKGRLEISLDGEAKLLVKQRLVFPPGEVSEIDYGVVGQKAKMAMDRVKESNGQERMCTFMGCLSGVGVKGMSGLVATDMGTMNRLSTLFSMV